MMSGVGGAYNSVFTSFKLLLLVCVFSFIGTSMRAVTVPLPAAAAAAADRGRRTFENRQRVGVWGVIEKYRHP